MKNLDFIKKRANELYAELEKSQDQLTEFLKFHLQEGARLEVERGKGIWFVEFVGADNGRNAGYFRARSMNEKVHTFHYSDIINIVDEPITEEPHE